MYYLLFPKVSCFFLYVVYLHVYLILYLYSCSSQHRHVYPRLILGPTKSFMYLIKLIIAYINVKYIMSQKLIKWVKITYI